jgi:hypothetical protein
MSSIAPGSFQRAVGSQINNDNNALAVRVVVLAMAGAILFARMPHSFLRPQLWGEDAIVFLDNYTRGARAIFDPLGGYLFVLSRLVAFIAGIFPVWMTPWIYNYAALAAVLALVVLVMSPRFDLPYKPLLAMAIVVSTSGVEVLLTLVNVQWVAPIGVMVLLLMREADNRAVRSLENGFVAITALTGPFSIFIFPISLCLYLIERRRRLLEFSIVLALGAAIQATFIGSNLNVFNLIEPKPYHWSLWITAPTHWFLETFKPLNKPFLQPLSAILVVVVVWPITAWIVWQQPRRWQKAALLAFALAVIYSGMFKYRNNVAIYNPRYAFAGSIFSVWLICCAADRLQPTLRKAIIALVLFAEVYSFVRVIKVERSTVDRHWPEWAAKIERGEPVLVPTDPNWTIKINQPDSGVIGLPVT